MHLPGSSQFPITAAPPSQGAEDEPRDCAGCLALIWQDRGGPVRFTGLNTLPSVVFTRGVHEIVGPGRTSTKVATGAPLCLPTTPPHTTHPGEDHKLGSWGESDFQCYTDCWTETLLLPCVGRPPF